MSYIRVLVRESPLSWAEHMKVFKKQSVPRLKAFKKENILKRYSLIQTGEHSGLLMMEFDSKAKMNKFVKTMAAVRSAISAETGSQFWVYHGSVKLSG